MARQQIGSREFYRLALCCAIAKAEVRIFILSNLDIMPNEVTMLNQKLSEYQSQLEQQEQDNYNFTEISTEDTRAILKKIEQTRLDQIEHIKLHEVHTFLGQEQPNNQVALVNALNLEGVLPDQPIPNQPVFDQLILHQVQQSAILLAQLEQANQLYNFRLFQLTKVMPLIIQPLVQSTLENLQQVPQPQPQNPVIRSNIGTRHLV